MLHVEFKKWTCRHVEFSGPDPYSAGMYMYLQTCLPHAARNSELFIPWRGGGGGVIFYHEYYGRCRPFPNSGVSTASDVAPKN